MKMKIDESRKFSLGMISTLLETNEQIFIELMSMFDIKQRLSDHLLCRSYLLSMSLHL